jgi:hypothetical protein
MKTPPQNTKGAINPQPATKRESKAFLDTWKFRNGTAQIG